jgi:transposase-like protein
VVKGAAMKIANGSVRRPRTSPVRRRQLLAQFARSGLCAAAFARQHQLNHTTFCGWRQRQANAESSPGFVEVELPPAATAGALVLELGTSARVRITAAGQIPLAAQLLQALHAPVPC